VRHNVEAIRSTGAPLQRIVAVGGGTQNPLWVQIISDVAGISQTLPALTIGASYGDAFLAGLAVGLLAREDLGQWVRPGQTIAPAPRYRERYDALYADYRALYDQTREIVHHLAVE
jgi:xylulokinase